MNRSTSNLLAISLVADDRAVADRARRARGAAAETDTASESTARAFFASIRALGTTASRRVRGAAVD
jgi:hypothetical protein